MTDAGDGAQTIRRLPTRTHSNFAARTARDDNERLHRRSFAQHSPPADEDTPLLHGDAQQPPPDGLSYHGAIADTQETVSQQESFKSWFRRLSRSLPTLGGTSSSQHDKQHSASEASKPRPGAFPRPVGGHGKLGTFAGVFVPVTLNVLSILMFLRFGFILGQAGLIGMMGMLMACYAINLLTTMSISAIATNGTVRGGGAYYLISRSLGPEFGGAIGIVFYLGTVFSTSLNAVGLVDCLMVNFGEREGAMGQWVPQSYWFQFLWATIVLAICTLVCLAGSGLFARASNGLLIALLVAIAIWTPSVTIYFLTLPKALLAALSRDMRAFKISLAFCFLQREEFLRDLKHPSKAIPKGTLYGLGLTFLLYTMVIFALAASISRETFYKNTNVIQLTNISGIIILLGELATSLFSVLMGVIGSAKLLQALARDHLIPGLSIFGQGTKKADEPIFAVCITYMIAQVTMFADINQIASFITMTYLMTFLVTNLACFLLKLGSAPNFRPSFHFFSVQTAALGTVVCGATMFFVDGVYASGCVVLLMAVFMLIHYTSPPKPWGDVSQGLIYHQVRKYLLRLRQEHVKFWRPQILLLVNDPRRQYKLIQFCNSLKKGGLFVLGHVIVTNNFAEAVPEARRQQQSWTKYIDFSRIKAFVNIAISPAVEWGARNLVLGAGLGGMRPNIVVMGFYNLPELRQNQPYNHIPSPQPSRPSSKATNHSTSRKAIQAAARQRQKGHSQGTLPTDAMKPEDAIGIKSYVTVVEDLVLRLQANVAVAKGFHELEVPTARPNMSSEIGTAGDEPSRKNVLTTNFDTYTLILQLGCILHTVPSWKRMYKLRVCVFVEYETDVDEERERVISLLKNLRIEATVLVFWLANGDLKMYEVIVNGRDDGDLDQAARDIDYSLEDERWWQDIKRLRQPTTLSSSQEFAQATDILEAITQWPTATFQHGRRESRPKRFSALQKMLRRAKGRASVGDLSEAGATLGLRSQRLSADLMLGSDSDSHVSSESEEDDADDEAVASESEAAISGSNFDEYDLDASSDESDGPRRKRPGSLMKRAQTTIAGSGSPFFSRKLDLRKAMWKSAQGSPKSGSIDPERPTVESVTPLRPHPGVMASDTVVSKSGRRTKKTRSVASSTSQLSSSSHGRLIQPPPKSENASPKFTSNPTPRTAVAAQEAPGPSIMFVDTPSPATKKKDPIADAPMGPAQLAASASQPATSTPNSPLSSATPLPTYTSSPASGFPAQQAIPLSFNDLPCRAQHLILNELIRQHSEDTAVVFTTLPSPVEGTCDSESESVKYISDLEVLCQGLPPVLLVHSNSMTVTMNL
ncbi:hypothetical protein SNOG_03799 [Parastagonospora nodorum SN15]|uniref:Amino acid permease/ SLC12A domain-containing protein n=1 Tax=Phaeosphaeria nodorum (strain SN15 / ATCC MYA-4574 / FGSC 10173) TaxID=321614 RepID=Q0UWR5_PHANO|nr:hypothetical protein SNOG_03799 [Parastagonospora nodorum SN15]EAT89004.2 hypothetical protein SNOG_03799 [Parastagonospora nodorum SN15]